MKLKNIKVVALDENDVKDAIRNLAFKKSPGLRNTSKLPEVFVVNKYGSPSFEVHVVLEVEESEIVP